MMVATGRRVSRKTQAPLRLAGTLSTAGDWDQSGPIKNRQVRILHFMLTLCEKSESLASLGVGELDQAFDLGFRQRGETVA